MGESFADHDGLRVAADIFPPLPGLRLTPAFEALRQGEGDFRVPMPDPAVFRAGPNLLLGTVERTYRFALRGRYQPVRHFWLTWDVGHNQVRNADHVSGRSRSEFVALGEMGLRFEFGARAR